MKKLILPIFLLLILSGCTQQTVITSFEECANAGNPIMESYPAQCAANGQTFIQEISVDSIPTPTEQVIESESTPEITTSLKGDIVTLTEPQPNTLITSPQKVTGQVPGIWFFEASFPVILEDETGQAISQGVAIAQSDWMTEDLVTFTAELNFGLSPKTNKGTLILEKSNASDLEELNDSYSIPIIFGS